ncbi:MAG: hypothetical protein LBK06_01615 [Planctomycetaceae bacterium]|nr:hypothetical protein [Planctomycetaceae bacterium]
MWNYLCRLRHEIILMYAKAVLKFAKLNTVAQQREAVVQGRSLLPYRLRYIFTNKFWRNYDGYDWSSL